MPETHESALARAKREGFPASSVRKGEKGWYIIPHGITYKEAVKAYLRSRDSGKSSTTSAKIAWTVQKIIERK